MNLNGCTLCNAPGTERYEEYTAHIGRKSIRRCQYDYRHTDGELFSCVASSVEEARQRRDEWLRKHGNVSWN